MIDKFVRTVLPWPVDDEPGFINLHWRSRNEQGEYYWGGRPVRTVKDFLWWTKFAHGTPGITDVYMCMSRQAAAGTSRNNKPIPVRTKDGATALRAVWLDVDVKADKGYPSLEAAVIAVDKFRRSTNLGAPSAIVGSGGGLHVYWAYSDNLTTADWQRRANGLRALAYQHGLICDYGVTTDAARILRVPGTRNFKFDPPQYVRLLGLTDAVLEPR